MDNEEKSNRISEVILPELICLRCGYKWYPRKESLPIICPKCNSPYWNKPRQNEQR